MKFLITAGPTREPIDPVRYVSNRSSGKMGYAIAEAAIESGHQVILISGPVCIAPPPNAEVIPVTTSDEMFESAQRHAGECDVCVMCAAVADFKPATLAKQKMKKGTGPMSLDLVATRDILRTLGGQEPAPDDGRSGRHFLLAGFAAETENIEQNALTKLKAKKCDIIVANDVSGNESGMESDQNEVTIYFQNGDRHQIPRSTKKDVARELVKIFAKQARKMFDKKNVEIT